MRGLGGRVMDCCDGLRIYTCVKSHRTVESILLYGNFLNLQTPIPLPQEARGLEFILRQWGKTARL